MDTRNTTLTRSHHKLRKAISLLEILGEEHVRPIVDYLTDCPEGSFLDLLVATRQDPVQLETALDQLQEYGILSRQTHLYDVFYRLERQRLAQISALARYLGRNNGLMD